MLLPLGIGHLTIAQAIKILVAQGLDCTPTATMGSMIELSYSTMNALIHEPHTFICKYTLALETFTTPYLEEGRRLHRIVQDHVSGRAEHPALAHLPYFPHVEQVDFDPAMKVRLPIDERFSFFGYVDGKNPQTKQFLEIKTGSSWSKQRFIDLVQWKLYAAALPDYAEVVFVNCPRSERYWRASNVRVYRHTITEADRRPPGPSSNEPSISSNTSTGIRSM